MAFMGDPQTSQSRIARLEQELQQMQIAPQQMSSNGFSMMSAGMRLPPLDNGGGGGGDQLSLELVKTINKQQEMIQKQQATIMQLVQQVAVSAPARPAAAAATVKPMLGGGNKKAAATLGIIRLDYDYPPSPGDIDHPGSFGYDVFYRVVPGLTFGICQSGKISPEVEESFINAVKWLEGRGVCGITGDCGFMMYQQKLARQHTYKPVFMSSLAQLPAITCAFNQNELICLVTANSETLKPMRTLIKDECGVDPEEHRFIIVGCQDVPGFEQVALGGKVDVEKVTPGVVAKCKAALQAHPKIRSFLFECTELPPYSDAVRQATGLPVWDSITNCDFFVMGFQDNKRFGVNDWQQEWDGKQANYKYGDNLSYEQKMHLTNKVQDA